MADFPAAAARASLVFARLAPLWPDARPLLSHGDCFQLLVAVILSAQCTDEQVNAVTPGLFAAYPGPRELASADPVRVRDIIHSTGFYLTKARNIVATARIIEERYSGRVPGTIEELVELPGVGRKTANLVVSACFGTPGIIVDTHVLRAARRLGIAPTDDPARSERMIADAVPREHWTAFSYAINRHGKHVCRARKPDCGACPVRDLCPSAGMA